MSAAAAELFCSLFDAVDPPAFRARFEAWDHDPGLRELSDGVTRAVLDGSLAEVGDHDDAGRFAVLRGLDRAFAHVNPATTALAPALLTEHALRYAQHGRFDDGSAGGALLPRFVRPGRSGQLPVRVGDAFGSVVRVPEADWKACDHASLPPWARLTHADRAGGVRVATTPLIADPAELVWESEERRGRRFYRIHPADGDATRERIARVVDGFDAQGATIGVAPELCLSPRLLEDWRAALAGRPAAASSALRLVLVGSGNVDGSRPPSNTAVLLDGQTGEALAFQRKVFPFNFAPADLDLWGLTDRFEAPIDEDLAAGERVCVIEAGGARLAILVCEDLARLHAFAAALDAHGVSLLLVPVFARPTKDRRWERSRAESYADATGSTIVVANSLVMASVLGADRPAGTAIAVASGEAVVGRASHPDEVVLFALGADGPEAA